MVDLLKTFSPTTLSKCIYFLLRSLRKLMKKQKQKRSCLGLKTPQPSVRPS